MSQKQQQKSGTASQASDRQPATTRSTVSEYGRAAEGRASAQEGRSQTGRGMLTDQQLAKFIMQHLRSHRGGKVQMNYDDDSKLLAILDRVRQVLRQQETLVKAKPPLKIVGDIHGQFTDLKRLFKANGTPPETKYIFLGDYVDRGKHSLECIMLLFAYKALYKDSVILLRGNHECDSINSVYGFFDELKRRNKTELYPEFTSVFNYLPLAAIINSKILCMHGGISKELKNLDQINQLRRPLAMDPQDSPQIAMDLLWADPDREISGYIPNYNRNISYLFGLDALEDFCRRTKIDLVVRGHQVVQRGFERIGLRNGVTRLVTVFSAPNYCNEEDNSAAVMGVSASLSITFSVLEPTTDAYHIAERNEQRANTPRQDVFPVAQLQSPPPLTPKRTAARSTSSNPTALI